jgi:hypothetical protein
MLEVEAMRGLAILWLGSGVVLGQPSALEIVRRSMATADRGWKAQQTYKYVERDEERHIDSRGSMKSEDINVSRIIFVNGSPMEETIGHNGSQPTAAEERKNQEKRHQLETESSAARAVRLQKEEENRGFLGEVPQAFSFRLIGADAINGRPAWILEATPQPGFRSSTHYSKIFSKVHGKLWVDQQDYGWVKVDASVIEPFSMGFVLARVQRGSHIVFEQTRVAEGIWLPKRIEVSAHARIFFFVNYATDERITYSDYRPAEPAELAFSTPH